MRYSAALLSAFILSSSAMAQTGFTPKTYSNVLPPASNSTMLLQADFNGDGYPDLLAYGGFLGNSGDGNIFLNDGRGGFLAPISLPSSGPGTRSAAQAVSLNKDGHMDIVACVDNYNVSGPGVGSLVVYDNAGNGSFSIASSQPTKGSCNALAVGDVNRDGNVDVVTVGNTGGSGTSSPLVTHVTTWLNDGLGHLTPHDQTVNLDHSNGTDYNNDFVNCTGPDVVGADFLGNGQFTLLLTANCQPNRPGGGGTVFLGTNIPSATNGNYYKFSFLQTSPEGYGSGQPYRASPQGSLDVIYIGYANCCGNSEVAIGKNLGNGNFKFSSVYSANHIDGFSFADFNHDGYTDLAVTHDPNDDNVQSVGPPMMAILSGTSSSSYITSQDFATGARTQQGSGIVTGDFNKDGKPDIATLLQDYNDHFASLVVYTNAPGTHTGCYTSSPGVVICSPTAGSTVSSPVTISADAVAQSGNITAVRAYIDGVAVFTLNNPMPGKSQQVKQAVTVKTGSHQLTVVGYQSTGGSVSAHETFTVR